MIVFGLLLLWADRRQGERSSTTTRRADSLKVGAAQVLALNPGTSRSGITITAARFLGFNRDSAARASFLMAIPVTAGAVAFKMLKLVKDGIPDGSARADDRRHRHVRALRLVRRVGHAAARPHSHFMPFVIYRYAVAVLIVVLVVTGVRSA